MRKNTKRLLAAAAAAAVLGGIYAALLLHPKEDETAEETTSLVSLESDKLASVHVALRDGSSAFTLQFSSDDSGTAYTMTGGNADADYSETLMETLMTAAGSVSAQPVEQGCADLSKYGLSDSDSTDTVAITDTDGNTTSLTLGLVSDVLGTYCTVNGGTDVYLLDNDDAQTLTQPQTYYRNLTVLGGYYSLSSELTGLTIDSLRDGTTVALSARDTSGLSDDEADAYSQFVFTKPAACDADDTALTSAVLSGLQSGLTAQSIVEDNPSDLRKYGLDTPVRIHLTANNLDKTVLIGDTADDGIYVMLDGGSTVFLSDASDFSFLDGDWTDWRSTTLLPCAMSQVDAVTVTQDGDTHTVDFTQVEAEENEDGDTDTTTATLDGDDMTDDALQQFFLAVTSVNYTRLVDDPQPADAAITVTVTLTDGTAHTLSFVKGGSREYLADIDGSGYAYGVPQDDVTSILDALKTE